ncbi:KilA, N- domain-containing protein, partial [Achromatium sp. WMS3]
MNDLHKASGGAKRHQPSNWLALQQTIELIEELSTPGIPGVE